LGRIQGIVAALILAAMVFSIVRRWDEIRDQPWQLNIAPLVLSTALVSAMIVLWALVWGVMIRRLGGADRPARVSARVYLYSNLARYLPGAIWNLVARAYLGHHEGLGQRRVWTATVIDLIVSVATGLILYVVTIGLPAPAGALAPWPVLVAAALIGLVVISPPALAALDRRIAARWGGSVVLGWRDLGLYLAASLAVWTVIGVAFYLFTFSLYPVDPTMIPTAIGVWSLSVVGGLVAIGVPQGLGIKEGILTLGLSAVMPAPVAALIAIGSRVWMICCDALAVGIWWIGDLAETKRRGAALRGWSAPRSLGGK
jgi:uncharacterized membrane protein YbhN (UPF0104 family)